VLASVVFFSIKQKQEAGAYQLTIHFSSILKSNTPPEWPRNTVRTSARTLEPPCDAHRSHTRTVQSEEPDTIKPCDSCSSSPSPGDCRRASKSFSNFKHNTLPRCASNVARHSPVRMHHTLIVLSREPVTIRRESKSRQ
jgi:hypothetical protein